jgi:hypothetical protein
LPPHAATKQAANATLSKISFKTSPAEPLYRQAKGRNAALLRPCLDTDATQSTPSAGLRPIDSAAAATIRPRSRSGL